MFGTWPHCRLTSSELVSRVCSFQQLNHPLVAITEQFRWPFAASSYNNTRGLFNGNSFPNPKALEVQCRCPCCRNHLNTWFISKNSSLSSTCHKVGLTRIVLIHSLVGRKVIIKPSQILCIKFLCSDDSFNTFYCLTITICIFYISSQHNSSLSFVVGSREKQYKFMILHTLCDY